MLNRKQFLRPIYQGAKFENDAVSVDFDWRFELVADYLVQSHSYLAVAAKVKGNSPRHPLPKDYSDVLDVYSDFGDFSNYLHSDWWNKKGKFLFGLKAPEPEVKVITTLQQSNPTANAIWTGIDSEIVAIPKTLTLPQALRQLKKILSACTTPTKPDATIAPKYELVLNRMRRETLMLGSVALSLYRKRNPPPLWKIGHTLGLVPSMVFDLKKERENPSEYGDMKATLATASRRLIRQAILISENAARGRFFTDKAFPEALIQTYKRKVGRPVGTKRTK
jgi:hypothetical protein